MIAIPNIDKPKSCTECPFEVIGISGYPRCVIVQEMVVDGNLFNRCQLIEIEDTEYEWCQGCKERDEENHCCHRWSNTIRNTVAELEEFYGKYITKHDQTLVIDYPNTDDVEVIRLMDEEGFTRVFVER